MARDWVHAYVAEGLAITRLGLYRPRMHVSDELKRTPARHGSGGEWAVRVGCVLCMQGALQRVQKPLHAALRPQLPSRSGATRLAEAHPDLWEIRSRCRCMPLCTGSFL